MTCKVCGEPRDIGDHSDCAASLERDRRPRRFNQFVPLPLDDEYEDLRDVTGDMCLPTGEE
jgi:hypothetical protein